MKKDYSVKMEKEAWGELIHHCFEHKKNEVNVDGFRKGQVPFDVYVKKFGVESLYMDAVDHALPELYDKLLEENEGLSLNMACRPEVNVKTISEDGLEVVFTVTMKPEVKLGKYKDLGIKKEEVTVTEEEINDELEHLRGHYAEYKEKDGTVENTDEANINFEGFKDGVAFAGGKGENYPLEIGSNTFIPGFEEQLIGMKKDEEKENAENSEAIIYAGNLVQAKSPFIYQLDEKKMNFKMNLYGIGLDKGVVNNQISYKGKFQPDELPNKLVGKLGLIWDGNYDESDQNEGMKRYTKYNNPHKLSCYLASGVPVIAWEKAAIADFINENNIGYTINSIYDINNISILDWNKKLENVKVISKNVRSGYYTKKIFEDIVKDMKGE